MRATKRLHPPVTHPVTRGKRRRAISGWSAAADSVYATSLPDIDAADYRVIALRDAPSASERASHSSRYHSVTSGADMLDAFNVLSMLSPHWPYARFLLAFAAIRCCFSACGRGVPDSVYCSDELNPWPPAKRTTICRARNDHLRGRISARTRSPAMQPMMLLGARSPLSRSLHPPHRASHPSAVRAVEAVGAC